MAKITVPKSIPPATIGNFLGINESSDGSTELQLGEASKMMNWRITDGGKLKKVEGYAPLFPPLGAGVIQGQWFGSVANADYHLFAHAGNIYKRIGEVNTIIGTMTDVKTFFFFFQEKVYMINGTEYKSWDGTTFADVAGHRALVTINSTPDGGIIVGESALYEEINLLNGMKRQTFSPTGAKTAYFLAEKAITSIDFVKVNGVTKTVTTDYTVDLTLGKVIFVTAPSEGVPGSVDIGWTKGTGDRVSVLQNMFATIYGGSNDTRVFFYGGSKNKLYFTGLADGIPSAEYFPANNFLEVGSDEYAVTGAVKQYDKLLIFTEKGSYYASYDVTTLATGEQVANFPTHSINASKGNIAPGQARNVLNNPFTLFEGVYEWALVQLGQDARNAMYKSKRVQPSLDLVDLTQAVTFDYEKNGEWWCVVDSTAWIYNYRVDVWYQRSNVTASNFIEIDGELYFGTVGTIMKFDPLKKTDDDTIINAVWEMGFFDFSAEYLNKYMNNIWLSMKPEVHASVDVQTVTNNDGTSEVQTIYYSLATFKHANFAHFSFHTSQNPQPFYLEVQCMGFAYFKLVLINATNYTDATILNVNLPARMGGKVR